MFKLKLDALMDDLIDKWVLGRPIGHIHVIEFQKRGLPHAHILILLHRDDKLMNPADCDHVICAELPDAEAEPELYGTVTSCMLHGPCGHNKPDSPCMKDGACTKRYRKDWLEETRETDGYPEYRRRYGGVNCPQGRCRY